MRYLVTGGAGFIGSHIVERLIKEGHFVRVLDNFSTGKRENLAFTHDAIRNTHDARRTTHDETNDAIRTTHDATHDARRTTHDETLDARRTTQYELIEGDIRDKSTCSLACAGIDYVLHQAALRSVPKSMKDPESYNDVNINGTLYMLQAAANAKVKRFVFASSSSVYGDTDKFPEREDAYPLLISPYALSKLAGEYYCRIFSEHFNLETVCLRYFNVFGPKQALDDEYAVVIPKFIHCILNDKQPPIFGTGKQSRDFTYIANVVEANFLAATRGLSPSEARGTVPGTVHTATTPLRNTQYSILNTKHQVFNVANGQDNTVLQLVDSLNKIIGKDIKPTFLPPRAGDVFRTSADISKISKMLGYKPTVSFEQGLQKTVEWFVQGDCPRAKREGLSPTHARRNTLDAIRNTPDAKHRRAQ